MTWKSRCTLAAALVASGATAAHAERIHALSLDQAITLAVANNPDSQSADADVDAAAGAIQQAHAFENPSLFVSSLGRELSPPDAPVPNQVGVTWTIPIGGKRAAAIAGADADADGARATRTATRRQLAFSVQSAFISSLRDAAALDFAKQDRAGIDEARQLEEIRYKDGKIAYNDVLKLRIQVGGADDTVAQAELALEGDRAELARLVGAGSLAPDFTLVGDLATPTDVPDLSAEQLLDRALSDRGDYQALLAGERSAGASLTAARRAPIPDLGVLLDYDRVPDSAGQIDLQLSVSIPLFDRNHGAIRQAAAGARKAHLASESLRAQIAADALTAVEAWKTSRTRLNLYDKELSSDAKESLDISRHAYEEGRGSLLDYLDAESSYRTVEASYLDAVADAMLAAANLHFVAGEDAAVNQLTMHKLAVVTILFSAACTRSSDKTAPADASERGALFTIPEQQRSHLTIVKALRKDVVLPVSLPALVAFDDLKTSEVTPLVGGKVAKVFVREGDKVKAGQPLASIASPDSSDTIANLTRDRGDLRSKKTILARDQDLYDHKAISLEELQQAKLDVDAATATVSNDQTHMSLTGSQGGGAVLVSPIAGVVVSRLVNIGDAVSAESTPCFTITDPTAVWVVSQLYQEDLRRIELGDTAHISSPVLDTPIDGKVIYVGASIDPDTLTIPVRVAAQNPDGLLKKGMYVDTEIVPAKTDHAIVVPSAAVLRDADNLPFVYVQAAPGQFARRPVQLGHQVGDTYVITQGLADGEDVLGDGALFVQFADSLD